MLFSKKDEEVNPEEAVEKKDESTEDSSKDPDPIDVHAFIDEKRRYAEDEALKIANMLAEEYHGVIEPLDVPNDLGSQMFFSAPRAYRVSTGTMRFSVFSRPRQKTSTIMDSIAGATEYEKSVARTKNIANFIAVHVATLQFDDDTGDLRWKHDKYIKGYISSENDTYNIRQQIMPSW